MSVSKLHTSLLRSSFTLSLLFGGLMIFAASAKAQVAGVAGKSYDVTITLLSTGDTEQACFEFDNVNTLTVTEPGGNTIFFTFAPRTPNRTGANEFRWQAVSRTQNFGVSGLEKVLGFLSPVSNLLDGNIVSQGGATLTFQGQAKAVCTPLNTFDGPNPGQADILQQL
ncbi:hypothetical protein LC653_39640 [Nostoc sp. CHAB 5784]|uniref:hypothetical protein n=1 Tax=Nostoc mirabile TaxID=2907820 RepID=UPI001E33959B|nr:hypothetical protein [Nostoc mirabile]MCC5669762.1 hypothetical protein [Nostoc mirabile CHAB5784]